MKQLRTILLCGLVSSCNTASAGRFYDYDDEFSGSGGALTLVFIGIFFGFVYVCTEYLNMDIRNAIELFFGLIVLFIVYRCFFRQYMDFIFCIK